MRTRSDMTDGVSERDWNWWIDLKTKGRNSENEKNTVRIIRKSGRIA